MGASASVGCGCSARSAFMHGRTRGFTSREVGYTTICVLGVRAAAQSGGAGESAGPIIRRSGEAVSCTELAEDLWICRPRIDGISLHRARCLDCAEGYSYGRRAVPPRRVRPWAVSWHQDWYGSTSTCLACGAQWADGEGLPRPFEPGWRERSKEAARRMWRKRASESHDGAQEGA